MTLAHSSRTIRNVAPNPTRLEKTNESSKVLAEKSSISNLVKKEGPAGKRTRDLRIQRRPCYLQASWEKRRS